MTLDKTDCAILHALQTDGRISNVALAQTVNLSESACLRRVKQLEDDGVIDRYVMLVDQKQVGYTSDVFVQISLNRQQSDDLARFETSVANVPEIMECYLMTGESDFLLRVIASDASDFERLHTTVLTRLPGVARVHSSFALRKVVKRTEVPIHPSPKFGA